MTGLNIFSTSLIISQSINLLSYNGLTDPFEQVSPFRLIINNCSMCAFQRKKCNVNKRLRETGDENWINRKQKTTTGIVMQIGDHILPLKVHGRLRRSWIKIYLLISIRICENCIACSPRSAIHVNFSESLSSQKADESVAEKNLF